MTIMMPSSCLSSVPAEVDSTPDLATPAASTGLMESHYPLMCRGAAAGDLASLLYYGRLLLMIRVSWSS